MRTVQVLVLMICCSVSAAADSATPEYGRQRDVIYGRKDGMSLTMDVFTPKGDARGVGVIFAVSSAFLSAPQDMDPPNTLPFILALVERGYTVFAVVHSSQPKYTLNDIEPDFHRAVRFIRTRAADFNVSPDRIGITGASSGGTLSLMQGVSGADGNAQSRDPVERASSRVQAVACFCPATDFLNFGETGRDVLDDKSPLHRMLKAAFDFHEYDSAKVDFERITDAEKIRSLKAQVSPITHITADDAPTLILHGSADDAVPAEQSHRFIAKLKAAGVACELIIRDGAGHNWPTRVKDVALTADWFDRYLAAPAQSKPAH